LPRQILTEIFAIYTGTQIAFQKSVHGANQERGHKTETRDLVDIISVVAKPRQLIATINLQTLNCQQLFVFLDKLFLDDKPRTRIIENVGAAGFAIPVLIDL
jgi:hypothetical protein